MVSLVVVLWFLDVVRHVKVTRLGRLGVGDIERCSRNPEVQQVQVVEAGPLYCYCTCTALSALLEDLAARA